MKTGMRLMRRTALATVLAPFSGTIYAQAQQTKPNTVFIPMDNVGYGEVGATEAVSLAARRRLASPKAFDLITDPKEEYPATALRNTWNAGPAIKIVVEFEKSLSSIRRSRLARRTRIRHRKSGGNSAARSEEK